jgi:hypothetical protein
MNTNEIAKSASSRGIVSHFASAAVLWPLGFASLVLGVALFYAGCSVTPVPPDPVTTGCSVTSAEFNGWFESGTVSLDGVVKPANSVTFPDAPNCSFYKWSEQMFLWLNSPAPPSYGGGGGRIFNSPAFYDVSPLDANMDRTFIAHSPGLFGLRNLSLRAAQVGPHGLPVIMDRRGTMLEIERPQLGSTGKQLILDAKGTAVEIERIVRSDNKDTPSAKPVFLDKAGAVIQGAHPLIRTELNKDLIVQKFLVDRLPILLNAAGNVVEVEQGQADGSVLMAQNGSLVYYQAMVNDVYAYFLTGVKDGAIAPGTKFPTTQADLDQTIAFAAAHGKTFVDGEALAIEVKTAWVEAAGLLNPGDYVTLMATIPTYDQTNPNLWVPNGQKTVLMALVGMHVVGSTAGHPEMIWATFEHRSNAPNATYSYNSTTGLQTRNPDFTGAWLFCAANPDVNHLNEPHMQQDPSDPANIAALPGFTISPSNTIRGNAWGATAGVSPNPVDLTAAASNSELISTNDNVRGMLDPADVRNKYIMTGATWTINGAAFNQNFGKPGNPAIVNGRAVGTSQMANTTMETYQQGFPTTFSKFSNNCFSCHQTNTTSVSHIFSTPGFPGHGLKPLF